MADENLIIGVKVEGGDTAVKLLGQVGSIVKTIVEDSDKLSTKLNKAMSSLSQEIRVLSAAVDLNKKYELSQQKIAQEVEKTANIRNRAATSAVKLAQAEFDSANKQMVAQQKIAQEISKTSFLKDKSDREAIKTMSAMSTAYSREQQEVSKTNKAIWNEINAELKAESTSKRLSNQINKTANTFNNFGTIVSVSLGNIAARAIEYLTTRLKEFISNVSQAGIAMDGITNTFAAGARGWKQGGEEMQFVADMADKLGLNLQATYEPYAKFMTSFTRSGGTLAESRQIFEDLSTAMVSLHLPASRMEGVFVALEQMANKGTVQAEELKRQLANALPGAFELAAQSMGITTKQLMDLMQKGEVVSRNFLPKFAATVKDSLGKQIGIAVDQYNAHLNRLQSQTWILQANLGQAWNLALTPIVKYSGQVLKFLNESSGGFMKSAGAVTTFQTALITAGFAMITFAKQFGVVNTGLAVMKANAIATAKALWAFATTPAGAVLITIGGAALYCANSINKANQEFSEQTVKILDVTNEVTGLLTEYSSLSKITNKTTAQQEAFNRVLGDLKSEYPELLSYITDNKINLDNLTKAQAENIASMAIQIKTQEAEMERQAKLGSNLVKLSYISKSVWRAIQASAVGVVTDTGTAIVRIMQIATKAVSYFLDGLKMNLQTTRDIIALDPTSLTKGVLNTLDKGINKLGEWSKTTRNAGNATIEFLDGIKAIAWRDVWTTKLEAQNEIEKEYKDTLAGLGQEQQKLADSLMYASSAQTNYNEAQDKSKKSHKEKVKELKTEFQELEALTNKQREELEVLAKNSKSKEEFLEKNKKLIGEYQKNVKAIEDVKKQINDLTETTTKAKSAYEQFNEKLKETRDLYKSMLLEPSKYSNANIESTKKLLAFEEAEEAYLKRMQERESVWKISSRAARDFGNTVVDSILTPLDEGESIWNRFKEAGISALKSIAQEWAKGFLQDMVTSFSLGFRASAKDGGGLIQNLLGGLSHIGDLFMGKSPLEELSGLNDELQETSNSLNNVINPALNMANSVATIASVTPFAGTAMNTFGAMMTTVTPMLAPVAGELMGMAGAMTALASSATIAASAMAAYAVSAAAASVAWIPIAGAALAPVAALATGAGIAAGTLMAGAAMGASSAMAGIGGGIGTAAQGIGTGIGGGFSRLAGGGSTKVIPHAKGGIVSSPTMFPMQGGNVGLAGEAGTEIIAPARRMSNGDLGIGAVQPNVTVNNYTNAAVEVIKRPDNEMEIKITELNAMLSSSRSNRGMTSAQSRMSSQGRRIG